MPKLVIGNWKMNPATLERAVALARDVRAIPALPGVAVGVAPPGVSLVAVADALRGSAVRVYAQDVHWEMQGAYTGQTAVSMLEGLAAGSIVGHSEMRRDQGDDDARVAKKVARALGAGLEVVLCVGESEKEYVDGHSASVVERQIARAVAGLTGRARLVVAYEPIWAIGTGRAANGAHAAAQAAAIRRALSPGADGVSVLYGGSVTAANAPEFAAAAGIDGALVGGASLKPDEFAGIVKAFAS